MESENAYLLLHNKIIKNCMQFLKTAFARMHTRCLNSFYPRTGNKIMRTFVPEDKISWDVDYPKYSPVSYTASSILALPSYADPDICDSDFNPKWNDLDENINRKSHETEYEIVSGKPRNYRGRTGLAERGCLGRWGPNHAADPVVTRWKIDINEDYELKESGKKILQFVAIERKDCGEWAIPGGMVDPGEKITSTLFREFMEEALNSLEMSDDEKQEAKNELQQLFDKGQEIYSGYVDDPRNTDNAWMETVAYNFHDDNPDGMLYKLQLTAGDDAKAVKWIDLSQDLVLYASHKEILQKVVEKLNAHW